jgi:hypothetical protein
MSSATSIETVRLTPDATSETTTTTHMQGADKSSARVRLQPDQAALQPWQFFVLVALACATAVTYFARGQGVIAVVLLGAMMGATALVGLAVLRAVRPLVNPAEDRTVMIGERTRAALEREKMLALRAIKELGFDRAMGKLSDSDWTEMSTRLRARAARLMHQLDAGAGYREQIEKDLAARLGQGDARLTPSRDASDDEADTRSPKASAERVCASCATVNDPDARFCKGCGGKL